MMLAEPVQIIQQVAEIFERLQILYLVGGSLASSLHGIPRATQDVDMVADLELQHIKPFIQALESVFYLDVDMIRDAIQRRSSFNIIHLETMFKVDIFVLRDDPMSQEEMARRERYQVSENPPQGLYLASAEDTVLQKLYWFQLGEGVSERQWNDVMGVLQVQSESLDYSYLQRGATSMGVESLLQQALKEAGIIK